MVIAKNLLVLEEKTYFLNLTILFLYIGIRSLNVVAPLSIMTRVKSWVLNSRTKIVQFFCRGG